MTDSTAKAMRQLGRTGEKTSNRTIEGQVAMDDNQPKLDAPEQDLAHQAKPQPNAKLAKEMKAALTACETNSFTITD